MVNIRKNYLNGTPKTKTELYNGKKIIIIHNTATPGATTKNEDDYFHREWARLETFVHAFVDWTGDAVEHQPAGCIAWGAGNVNKYAWLQVEQCIGTDEQNRQSAEYVAQYVAEKIKASGEPFESFTILSHAEASLKFDGSDHMDSIVGVGLPDFINRVKELTRSKVETTSTGSTGVLPVTTQSEQDKTDQIQQTSTYTHSTQATESLLTGNYPQMVTSGFLSLALVVVFGIYQYVSSKTQHIGAKLKRGDNE